MERPDHVKARQWAQTNFLFIDPATQKPPYLIEERLSKLRYLGRPPALYFTFLKLIWLLLFVLSLLYIGQIYVYYSSDPNNANGAFFRAGIANWSMKENVVLATWIEVAVMFVSIIFIRFYSIILRKVHDTTRVLTVAKYSIYVVGVPKDEVDFKGARLKQYFSRYGEVDNVALILNAGNVEKLKRKNEMRTKKVLRLINRVKSPDTGCFSKLVLQYPLRYYKSKLFTTRRELTYHLNKETFGCVGHAFVTFKTETARFRALQEFNPATCKTCCNRNATPKFEGKRLKAFLAKEPQDILWENFEFGKGSKFGRRLLSVVVSAMSIIFCLAVAVGLEYLRRTVIAKLTAGNGVITTLTSIVISIVIFIVSSITTYVLYYLAKFERHRFESRRKRSLMFKLIFAMLFLEFISMASYIEFGNTKSSTLLDLQVPTFKPTAQFGYSLCLYYVLGALNMNIKEALLPVWHNIIRKWKANDAITQEELNEAYVPPRFTLEYRYAYVVKAIMSAISLSGFYPPALYICLLSLMVSYAIDKHNLFRIYRKFDASDDLCNKGALKCIGLAFIFRYLILALLTFYDQLLALSWNMYSLALAICFVIYVIYYIFEFSLPESDNCRYCCVTRFKSPDYFTMKGEVPIDAFYKHGTYQMGKYIPPVLPHEVNLRHHARNIQHHTSRTNRKT